VRTEESGFWGLVGANNVLVQLGSSDFDSSAFRAQPANAEAEFREGVELILFFFREYIYRLLHYVEKILPSQPSSS